MISQKLANLYLKEIHYKVNSKYYYAVGFPNDKGGFELRSRYFKGGTSPKWITTVPGSQEGTINLFEGFFDFLSCCEHHKTVRLKYTSIILNTLSMVQETLPCLSEYQRINIFFDNDKAGEKALEKLKQTGLKIVNCSYLYTPHKDYNEYYMHYHIKGHF